MEYPEDYPHLEDIGPDLEDTNELFLDSDLDLAVEKEARNADPGLASSPYTLDTALLPDLPEGVLYFLQTGHLDPRFKKRGNIEAAALLLKQSLPLIDWGRASSTEYFHRFCVETFFQADAPFKEFRQLLDSKSQFTDAALEVVRTFIQATTGEYLTDQELSRKPSEMRTGYSRTDQDGEFFWITQILVNLMNAANVREVLSLTSLIPWASVLDNSYQTLEDTLFAATVDLPPWGKVTIVPGFAYFHGPRVLIDRACLLMIKDTLIARYCSKLSLCDSSRPENKEKLYNLTLMYEKGDDLLVYAGNDAFRIIKLLEPHCNLRWTEIGAEKRPEVPLSPDFASHLDKARRELEKYAPLSMIEEFFCFPMGETDPVQIGVYYGSFRHWGHPFIDYEVGLEKLYQQVQGPKNIDTEYVRTLASDLAKMVLEREFKRQRKWFVQKDKIPEFHPFKEYIDSETWPPISVIVGFGDNWDSLPMTPSLEIPRTLDPSVLLADKSHCPDLSEVKQWVAEGKDLPFQTKKVLETALKIDTGDLRDFCQSINDAGLAVEYLIIAIKEKERENKVEGRYYAMMSWFLRLYFVLTEHLIKRDFLDLFPGITMKDSLNEVQKKLLNSSHGQNSSTHWSFSNHIDYEKWNNHQRYESTAPIFTVMGQCYGLPRLFERTHQFFQDSFVFYASRADTLVIENGELTHSGKIRTSWKGQKGGLEGLRQKGWTLVSMLVLNRECRTRNTRVDMLAQGDNQVITTSYKKGSFTDPQSIRKDAINAARNNQELMENVRAGVRKLGLIINEDETIVSSEFLNYGKLITLWGNRIPVETKRYSRATCATNDQLPGVGPIISSIGTLCLTVCQSSESIVSPMIMYVHLACMGLATLLVHDPAAHGGLGKIIRKLSYRKRMTWWLKNLFLDPSLGGVAGMSLNRFLIRGFPDPVTESLTFAKIIAENSSSNLTRRIFWSFGNPDLKVPEVRDFPKLLENPASLNLTRGLSAPNMVRQEIRKFLINKAPMIANPVFREGFQALEEEEEKFLNFAIECKPCFPRFLSELRSCTMLGLIDSYLGLYQSSRTIKNNVKKSFKSEMSYLLCKAELDSVCSLSKMTETEVNWKCSSTLADYLRTRSWGEPIIGTTIPHPSELIGNLQPGKPDCKECSAGQSACVTTTFPSGFSTSLSQKGPLSPYMGSRTAEMAGLYNYWEKVTKSHIVRNAADMRRVINWFVDAGSNVSKSLFNILEAFTGESWDEGVMECSRTGSPLHRFKNKRTSDGGYAPTSPNLLTYVLVTSDTLGEINRSNYDFVYQSLLLYAQQISIEKSLSQNSAETTHCHIKCLECLRPLEEVTIESTSVYNPSPGWCESITRMGYCSDQDVQHVPIPPIPEADWSRVLPGEASYRIGVAQGTSFSVLFQEGATSARDPDLFPKNLPEKIRPSDYLRGLVHGLTNGAALSALYRRTTITLQRPGRVMRGGVYSLIEELSNLDGLHVYLENQDFRREVQKNSGHMSVTHPPKRTDSTRMLSDALHSLFKRDGLTTFDSWDMRRRKLVIFSDFRSARLTVLFVAAWAAGKILTSSLISGQQLIQLYAIKKCASHYSSKVLDQDETVREQTLRTLTRLASGVYLTRLTIRKAVSDLPARKLTNSTLKNPYKWGKEKPQEVDYVPITFVPKTTGEKGVLFEAPKLNDPLISCLRLTKIATGGYLKISGIVDKLSVKSFVCLGDGSGGMTSYLLRRFPESRGIFNSKMTMEGYRPQGVRPGPPSAIYELGIEIRGRCLNLTDNWEAESNLTKAKAWTHLLEYVRQDFGKVDLIVADMEYSNEDEQEQILIHLVSNMGDLLSPSGTLIYKTFWNTCKSTTMSPLRLLGPLFNSVKVAFPALSQSFSSEFYLVMSGIKESEFGMTIPSSSSLKEVQKMVRAFSSISEEFKRATMISVGRQLTGVPLQFQIQGERELESIMSHLGVPNGLIEEISTTTKKIAETGTGGVTAGLYITGIVSNMLVRTTSRVPNSWFVPSNGTIENLLGFSMGIQMVLARRIQRESWYEKLHEKCQEDLKFRYLLKVGSDPESSVLYWAQGEQEGYRTKTVGMFPSGGVSTAAGRAFCALLNTLNCPNFADERGDTEELDRAFSEIDDHLTYDHLRHHTGTWDPVVKTARIQEHHKKCPVLKRGKRSQARREFVSPTRKPDSGVFE